MAVRVSEVASTWSRGGVLASPEVAKAVTEMPKAGRATAVTAREVMVAWWSQWR